MNQQRRCVIIAGAPNADTAFLAQTVQPEDYLICADRGYAAATAAGLRPDLIVGDFDSYGGALPDDCEVVRLCPEKDDTDMMIAVKEGLRRGFSRFALFGGLGGRLGHTLANIQTLAYLSKQGARGFLCGERETVAAVTDGTVSFSATHTGYISVFCLDEPARGVTLRGLKYPLNGAVLTASVPLGVSNEFTGTASSVTVENGTLVIVWGDGRLEEVLRA